MILTRTELRLADQVTHSGESASNLFSAKLAVHVTDGQLPYPYGQELTGYEVSSLSDTLAKGESPGVSILVQPYSLSGRIAAIVEFPGGSVAEIHEVSK